MNIAQFCKEFNDRTKHIVTGVPIPTIIHYKVIINAIINAKMSSEPENSSNRKLPRIILPPRWGVGGGEGVSPIYKSDRDTRGKIKMKPLRETNVGVAEA